MNLLKKIFFVLVFLSSAKFASAQTFAAPDLQCINTPSAGNNLLTWTCPAPDPCGPFVGYLIWGSNTGAAGPYFIIDTIFIQNQTTYVDSFATGTWYYYMETFYACAGYSSLQSDTLNNQLPLPPVIEYVTAGATNNAFIQFQPSTSASAYAYIIYYVVDDTVYFPIDTVYNGDTTQYFDPGANTSAGSVTYSIATMDSCGNTGLISTIPHKTIFTTAITTGCSITGKLYWTKYINWTGGVDHYDVFVSIANQPNVLLIATNDTFITFDYGADSLCFTVVGYAANGLFSSSSNKYCLPPNPNSPVQDFYVRNVTVTGDGVIDVYYSMNKNSDVRSMKMERGIDGVNFNDIDIIPVPSDLSIVNVYTDNTPLTADVAYYYRLQAIDSCGVEAFSSVGKSILLEGGAFSNQTNHLNWDQFFLTHGDVMTYTIFRKATTVWDSITRVSSTVFDHQESVAALIDKNGTLCYVVIATDSAHYPNGIIDTVRSSSNELCIDQLVKILVPNAFAPNGKNNLFKPVLRFADNKSYLFEVYNRWGGKIFSTTDAGEGWDGTFQGKLSEQGVYAYLVQVTDNNGFTNEDVGTVMLLR